MAGLALALASTAVVWRDSAAPRLVTTLLVIDRFACFYYGLMLVAALAVTRSLVHLPRTLPGAP